MTQEEIEKMYGLMERYDTENWKKEDAAMFDRVRTRVLVDICRDFYPDEGSFKVKFDLVKKTLQ